MTNNNSIKEDRGAFFSILEPYGRAMRGTRFFHCIVLWVFFLKTIEPLQISLFYFLSIIESMGVC